jgi:uncharacterized protein with HEPN domain
MREERIHALVDQIEEASRLATSYVESLNKQGFLKDKRTQQAVTMNLMIIGEAASRLAERSPRLSRPSSGDSEARHQGHAQSYCAWLF